MTDRPILFSAPMIRALLDGRKTMTRRLAWRDAEPNAGVPVATVWQKAQPGDRLWVRENLARSGGYIQYAANRQTIDREIQAQPGAQLSRCWPVGWKQDPRPSIHMPRTASRLTLVVTATKIERLQDISETDAVAEGAPKLVVDLDTGKFYDSNHGFHRIGFAGLWRHLHGDESWDANPEVVALTFTVQQRNIDAMERNP